MKKYSRATEALFVQQENETAILNSKTERYFALDEVGTFIWNCLEKPSSVEEIAEKICREYDVDKETSINDTADLIREMEQARLVTALE